MTKLEQAARLALEALEESGVLWKTKIAITALREALAEHQELVAWMLKTGHGTYFQETISEEQKELEFGGKKMWVPLYRQQEPHYSNTDNPVDFPKEQNNE